MKKNSTLLKTVVIAAAFLLPFGVQAQDEVGDLFKSSPQDATKLVDAYMSPLFKGMGLGLNSGWFNSAKSKGTLRFDLRISATAAFVPTKDQTYDAAKLGLSSTIRPAGGSTTAIGPTAFGDDTQGAKMEFYTTTGAPTGSTFNLPQGTGLHFVPAPQLQLTVGLPKNIDVSLRYVPNVKLGDDAGKINQFGLGAKIEVLPLIMGEKTLPFDLAVGLGFTNTTYTLPLDINNGKYTNQEVEVKFKGFSAEAIISKKLLFFTPFASVGFNSSNSSLNAYGTYDFETTNGAIKTTTTFTDPISLKHGDISGLKASVGAQLNLAFFRIFASYTQAEYGYANAGIGFGFGK